MFIDDHADFTRHEIRNAVMQILGTAPASPVEGLFYGLSTTKRPQYYDGTTWRPFLLLGDVTGSSGDVTQAANSTSTGALKVSAGANKSITDYTGGAGLIKVDAGGVVSTSVAGVDYLTAASTNALTNKTFDANGAGNSISNIETADLAAGVLNTSSTLAGATATQVPSALAVSQAITTATTGVTRKYSETFGDGVATSFVITHNLGTQDVVVQVRDASTNEVRYPTIVDTSATTVTLTMTPSPATNSRRAVIIG